MTRWNEQRLEELVRKMGVQRTPGQGETPIHLSLYGSPLDSEPLLTKIVRLNATKWRTLGYTETDRVSVVRYLGSLGCRTGGAMWAAAAYQQPLSPELTQVLIDAGAFDKDALRTAAKFQRPLTLELAKLLIDAGAFNKEALSVAARCQRPLTLELAKLLIDAGDFNKEALQAAAEYQKPLLFELAKLLIDIGCDPIAQDDDGWDALVFLAYGGHSVDPQTTDLLLSAGCRTDLDGCGLVDDEHRIRFDQILKEHAQWKESLGRMSTENSPTDASYGPDWGR